MKCFCFMGNGPGWYQDILASNSAQKISHGMHTAQTISDKEEGAARHLSKCRFYPSNGPGPLLKRRRRMLGHIVEWQFTLRCAFCQEQKRAVFQDNTGRILSCLGPQIHTIIRSENPFVSSVCAAPPRLGATLRALAMQWWLFDLSGHLTSRESTRKSRVGTGWQRPPSSHFSWPVLLMHRWRYRVFFFNWYPP